MPYFQRTRSPGHSPPADARAAGKEVERSSASVVERAVAILDQQLAAQPLGSAPDPARLKTAAPESIPEVGDRYRRVHELLQELLTLFAGPGGSAPTRAHAALPIATTAPVLKARAVKAGEAVTVVVPLLNDRASPIDLIFYSTDFVSDGGFEIPSLEVSFAPRTLALAGHARGQTDMRIAVPARSPAGLYSALVQATGLTVPQAVVVLEVE